jgi:DNA polymerase-3 subunit beta
MRVSSSDQKGRCRHDTGAALAGLCALLPDADVQVKLAENQWASFVCGRSRTRIAGMSRESFPELPQMPEPLAEIPLSVLSQMISSTIFAISAEESPFHIERCVADFAGHRSCDGDDGWSPARHGGKARESSGLEVASYRALLPKKAMSGDSKAGE